jgi:putative two-component system response regulator
MQKAGEMPEPCSVVLVDDDTVGLAMLHDLISGLPSTDVASFADPNEALAWCRANRPDVFITDFSMPGLSGLDLIRELRQQAGTREIPIMMITASDDRAVRYEALQLGANDFLGKPVDPLEVKARTLNMLAIRRGQRALADRAQVLEQEVRAATEAIHAREHETILRLARAAEYRDWETGSHIVRVAWYSRIITKHLGLSDTDQEMIFKAAPMHDVGKVGVPDYILLKPSGLDDHEFSIMKEHTLIGHRILGGSSAELLTVSAEIALSHHERWNGSGYPEGRAGKDIPIGGRIVAVADTFDALTSTRPYKSEWPSALAWAYLQQQAGVQFEAECVAAFERGRAEVQEVQASFPNLPTSSQHPEDTPMARSFQAARTLPGSAGTPRASA